MKYYNKKYKDADGNTFDSKAEMERWYELKHLEKKGEIECLKRQVRFEILPKITRKVIKKLKTKEKVIEKVDEKAKYYTADFFYLTKRHGYVEDVKSKMTAHIRDYPLRRHLMKMVIGLWNDGQHGEIQEHIDELLSSHDDEKLKRDLFMFLLKRWNIGESRPIDDDGFPIDDYWEFREVVR